MTNAKPERVRDAQIKLLVATSRLLDAADDVRRDRDKLFALLGQTQHTASTKRTEPAREGSPA